MKPDSPEAVPVKKIAVICLLLAIGAAVYMHLAPRAHTGLILVQTFQSAGNTWTSTTKIAGSNVRHDEMDVTSTLFDLATGDTTLITHPSRTFVKLSMAQMVAKEKSILHEETSPPEITDTGNKEKVGGYNAEIYTAETPSAKFTCWITKDYPDYSAINAQLKKYRALEKSGALFPDLSNIDGLMVKYEIDLPSGKTTTATLVSAKIQPIRDSDFRTPAGYVWLPSCLPPPAAKHLRPHPVAPCFKKNCFCTGITVSCNTHIPKNYTVKKYALILCLLFSPRSTPAPTSSAHPPSRPRTRPWTPP